MDEKKGNRMTKPEINTIVLNLPDDMVGKTIEVVATEIKESTPQTSKKSIKQLHQELEGLTLDLSNFKFNRDEANDYD